MFWGAFCKQGKSELAEITHHINAQDYQDMFCDYGLEFLDRVEFDDEWIFQQDNARPHSANSTKEFFRAMDIYVMEWPPYSPDLNPIENLWGILSRSVYNNGRQYSNVNELKTAIKLAWDEIPQSYIDNLIASMPSRVFSVIAFLIIIIYFCTSVILNKCL